MIDPSSFVSKQELARLRYQCSHKLVVMLSLGAVYLGLMSWFVFRTIEKKSGTPDASMFFLAAGFGLIVIFGTFAAIVHRSQTLNFVRFLEGCVRFDTFELMLDYVEIRMPSAFPARIQRIPIHLMILGKVLEHSQKAKNADTGRRMIETAIRHDAALEAYRTADLRDLMKYYDEFLEENPQLKKNWMAAANFHNLLIHYILPVTAIVIVISLILKGCNPPE